MGRVFEKRKHKMFARYAKMAKAFTKLGREIVIAVKAGGPNPDLNSRLRAIMQNAKSINMPKDRIDSAIKRASEKDSATYEEVIYEGYGPHKVPMLIECATDNPNRTVANLRMYFTRSEGGALATSGAVSFLFDRKAVFRINAAGLNKDEVEFDLIDYGAEEYTWDDESKELIIQTSFNDYGSMQKALEDKKYEVKESSKIFIPNTVKELTDEQEPDLQALIDKLDEDDDVLAVYHNAQ
ncbi:MAG: YebC/PmpR family DNA-binding transcriptional regulator [Bacteroidia bacterium]